MLQELINEYGEEVIRAALEKVFKSEANKNVCSNWAVEEIEQAKAEGITDGSRPGALATREEVMLMVYRAQKK